MGGLRYGRYGTVRSTRNFRPLLRHLGLRLAGFSLPTYVQVNRILERSNLSALLLLGRYIVASI